MPAGQPLVFSPPIGMDIKVIWRPKVQNFAPQIHASGREVIVGASSYPLHEFELIFNMLRNTPTQTEFKYFMGFYLESVGGLNPFLFQNPYDDSVTAQAAINTVTGGVLGDSSTTDFLLVRYLGTSGSGAVFGTEPVGYVWTGGGLPTPPQAFNVYLNGVLQSSSSYTLYQYQPNSHSAYPAYQILSFNSAPGTGVAVTVDMSYYYYVRFGEDTQDLEQVLYNIFQNKKLLLMSKKA